MAIKFNVPPNWPPAPPGWRPPEGWRPDPAWGPAPQGWQFWIEEPSVGPQAPKPTPNIGQAEPVSQAGAPEVSVSSEVDVPLFGARGKAQEYAARVQQLERDNESLRNERDQLQSSLSMLRADMDRVGALSVIELEQRREELERSFVERRAALQQLHVDHKAALDRESQEASDRLRRDRDQAAAELASVQRQLGELQQQVVVTTETALLQEAGIYEYRHPLADAVAYQAQLARLQAQIKIMTKKDGGAVEARTGWTVNGSLSEGRVMIRDFSKLMLRAYNAEADNLVRGMKPYKLDSSAERLTKVASTIARLSKTMGIHITGAYHRLRVNELELAADYMEKVAEEKQRDREEKARLREERQAQQEIERERARLEKERQHYANALDALLVKGDEMAASKIREQLAEIDNAIQDVDFRAANVRAGYVYVISNLGAFGERMVKIGMTRRLDPLDRIRELSDASVPFNFDVHALFFAEDAVGIEGQMHARLADRRVNLVNQRREFFYATPHEVKQHLLELAGNLLQYDEVPEALEYRQSTSQPRITVP